MSNLEENKPLKQDLDVYWTDEMAQILETWGIGHVWNEIQFLMGGCSGRVLDIACGTGKTMEILKDYSHIDLYGCDISDLLISKAKERGIAADKLVVCDATAMDYPDGFFDYAYTIGSLEHFTEEGIEKLLVETKRLAKKASFHMVPVSKSNKDEGWKKTFQSFHNNSVEWWVSKYSQSYGRVHVIDSGWSDHMSIGKWFLCYN